MSAGSRSRFAAAGLAGAAGALAAAAASGARWAAPFAAASAAAAALLGLARERRLERGLRALEGRARRPAPPSAPGPAPSPPPELPAELAGPARAIDAAAREAAARIAAAEEGRADLEALLDAMGEAVFALDDELRITLANPAAAALFGLGPPSAARGRELLEATRSTALHAAARECLETGLQREAELSLFLPGERWFLALAAPLGAAPRKGAATPRGAVLVLNDVTELRRLERVRRDFVANVSHELRTPVQLVKGFAEALREGAIGDPARADRFLGIIERNAERMEALISDLLALASLEGGSRGSLEVELAPVSAILEAAAEAVGPKASAKDMELRLDCEEGLAARVNAGLLEQALVNLMDNAVKYSPAGSPVIVSARRDGAEGFAVSVKDRGLGIPARDLGRIFERFYRVDRARSRELGGTGLGLAIVRHIALAHGGSVSVESWEGEGSTFTLRLPLEGPPGRVAGLDEAEDHGES